VKLIGRYDKFVADVGERDGVELCGEVPDITEALADVDVIVVPVRFGGGTRIKVLEAFARGLPVVSTTVGCEGIPVEDDVHLLIADEPADFARACVRLVRDDTLRARVVAGGRDLWKEHFRWVDLRPQVAGLARRVVVGATTRTPPSAR
jgi:glycosyltransferase involved in cell wall biosynthesis